MISSDPTAIDIKWDPQVQRMSGIAFHGNTPFDVPYISHIEGNLWTGGCADHLILPKHIEHVISLYPWEQYQIRHQPKSVLSVWLYDSNDLPPIVHEVASWGAGCAEDGPTLIHCQAGLNRSSTIAALVLMEQGKSAQEAIDLLREKRSPAVLCNKFFEEWLLEL